LLTHTSLKFGKVVKKLTRVIGGDAVKHTYILSTITQEKKIRSIAHK
jgi:hypothetical protein